MTRDLKIAAGSAALYASVEMWLGQQYPLAKPVPLPVRMAVAGGLAFLTVVVASHIVNARTA